MEQTKADQIISELYLLLDQFYAILIKERGEEWFESKFKKQVIEKMMHFVLMHKETILKSPANRFQIYGIDLLFDTNDNLWLIESNLGPSLAGEQDDKRRLIKKMSDEFFYI